jgi:hypothetical protein
MSSTNRGYERHKVDFYVTPQKAIREFFGAWLSDMDSLSARDHTGFDCDCYDFDPNRPDKATWLDPCAGGDATHLMSYPEVIKKEFGVECDTIDYREDSLAQRKEDYLLADIDPDFYDVIITNPPFYYAQEIITKALRDVKDGGYVVMLLRLNFFGSNERKPFWDKQLPILTYVHHRRFSFTDDGKTDSIEYMHAVWQKGVTPEFTMLRVI